MISLHGWLAKHITITRFCTFSTFFYVFSIQYCECHNISKSWDFRLWFISPQHCTPVFYTPVSVCFGPRKPFLLLQKPEKWELCCPKSDLHIKFGNDEHNIWLRLSHSLPKKYLTLPCCNWLKVGWWFLPFDYVAKKYAVLLTQHLDHFKYTIWILLVHCMLPYFSVWMHAFTQNSKF